MGDLTKKTTITAEGLDNLIEVLKGKPKLASFLSAFLDQLQDLEDASFQVLFDTALANSVGEQLDVIGRIVGRDRGGLNDADYRVRIQAQILINKTSGTVEELIAILVLFETSPIRIQRFEPAAHTITIPELLTDPDLLASIISDARAGGVGSSLQFTVAAPADSFTFATGDTIEAGATTGFSNDGGTSGGKFAEAVGA